MKYVQYNDHVKHRLLVCYVYVRKGNGLIQAIAADFPACIVLELKIS